MAYSRPALLSIPNFLQGHLFASTTSPGVLSTLLACELYSDGNPSYLGGEVREVNSLNVSICLPVTPAGTYVRLRRDFLSIMGWRNAWC